ncbi:protein translocase subunit SecD [Alcaligenes ammonioxydans]|jgi:preprotein translocase subunit SecD|uniref:Protein translocase subunit SecD n=1 Tax=Alcaligenes ammonioxydans TaxID=2582914 RepID=A0ABX8SQ38_9BURK|nr:protein translocase subunit SecD [Alcaligenes ammonioxydans]EJC61756.1 preprotein translocase subunit SecD [Alcaligenes faecalis subsp. faecalis NCIB 8687]QBH20092.1 protein translocase subunit SecD [Alcaligenes faecalis]MCH1879286.1 protein translocase subunit SecD [Alcaligenes ammonioxydans]QXX78126.1 protein translocase subunit SecD [Alcaligenes ammonioxydans]WGQ36261.1 protein translocase subunit SecD [Alcaligenes faecalis]
MNRYPLWKYAIVLVALAIGLIYTLPNLFGESPAVQVSSAKSTVRLETSLITHVEALLKQNNIPTTGSYFEQNGPSATARFRFASTDVQLKAKDLIERELNKDSAASAPDYTVALNLVSASPAWLTALGAHPMHLGLDLRGGVHFLLQVDMQGALTARYDSMVADARSVLREAKVPVGTIEREGQSLRLSFASADERDRAQSELRRAIPDLAFTPAGDSGLTARLTETATIQVQTNALTQNITTLHNRINELGVAEPVIQQQGSDRIVVQLPGVQDVAKAKEILGRTATLELRMVEDSPAAVAALNSGTVPFGLERYTERGGAPLLLRRQVILTGENLQDAQPGRDSQTQQPTVNLTLDNKGSRIFRDITRNNINKRMAIVLFENGVGEVVTAPVIRSEIPNGQVQISGSMNAQEAADISLLLRAGSLAAPMSIIEERTIGPSLGADNIRQGFNATLYGFIAIAIFIMLYYHLIGLFSTIGLTFNVLLLLAVLSMLQATLTLPGIAAIALTLGMAIDANVLINERIREELRNGASPQQAIHLGFDRAWATIFDSNLTSLIVGVALLAFGSGPIRGFAVVHVIGILTSMFSSVVGVRALVNLWYGNRRRLQGISIGQVWKPQDKK